MSVLLFADSELSHLGGEGMSALLAEGSTGVAWIQNTIFDDIDATAPGAAIKVDYEGSAVALQSVEFQVAFFRAFEYVKWSTSFVFFSTCPHKRQDFVLVLNGARVLHRVVYCSCGIICTPPSVLYSCFAIRRLYQASYTWVLVHTLLRLSADIQDLLG